MATTQSLRGFTTISYWAADLEAAKRWYTELLGIEPYFQRPGYCEFRIGDYQHELGLIESKYAPFDTEVHAPAGAIMYWHVDDVNATFQRLLSLGAKQLDAPVDRGHGFMTASVVDPFGNILGIMYNPTICKFSTRLGKLDSHQDSQKCDVSQSMVACFVDLLVRASRKSALGFRVWLSTRR